jgi:hypothetical protein
MMGRARTVRIKWRRVESSFFTATRFQVQSSLIKYYERRQCDEAQKNAKMTMRIICALGCAVLLSVILGATETQQRFPAPLGLNKVLTGTVIKVKVTPKTEKDAAKYLLKSEDATYQLRGHEKQLKRMLGKKVHITGNTVGENVTVDSVERAPE